MDDMTCFKFQSDSINTMTEATIAGEEAHFKFQSDSINTEGQFLHKPQKTSLNSNLILLIREASGQGS